MRIMIDATSIADMTFGTSQYAWRLLQALAELDSDNYYHVLIRRSLSLQHPLHQLAQWPNFILVPTVIRPGSPLQQFKLLQPGTRPAADVFHCLNFNLPLLANPYPSVCTIHDLKFLIYPDLLKRWIKLKRFYFQIVARLAVSRCVHVIAVSEATRQDVIRYFGVSPHKVTTIYEASALNVHEDSLQPDSEWLRNQFGIRAPYFFMLGYKRPHKNLERAIAAFLKFLDFTGDSRWQLVITGGAYKNYDPLHVLSPRYHGKIVTTGYVDEATLDKLYRGAYALFFPSLYEGFGLPLLEAMERGVPVITSNVSSLPEVAGEAALFVDPHSVSSMAHGLMKMTNPHIRQDCIRKGLLRSAKFNWHTTASKTLEIYRKAISKTPV
ncbi:MAG: glycosyltransferase family 4 protein [Deltaproteobacteria bacterium]|nr:glycosyltransferase family 4 protein [Deltaproteobacteria bacterium]MBW2152301.1 glycosyltransferase family 4 protein [Deltaproteobacteria bacterium]